jgi:hypothetical protein
LQSPAAAMSWHDGLAAGADTIVVGSFGKTGTPSSNAPERTRYNIFEPKYGSVRGLDPDLDRIGVKIDMRL